jgi:hypothetical protein
VRVLLLELAVARICLGGLLNAGSSLNVRCARWLAFDDADRAAVLFLPNVALSLVGAVLVVVAMLLT